MPTYGQKKDGSSAFSVDLLPDHHNSYTGSTLPGDKSPLIKAIAFIRELFYILRKSIFISNSEQEIEMAEIKSTMEMVLERAARMSERSSGPAQEDEIEKEGMRMAAYFLDGTVTELNEELLQKPNDQQTGIRNGMIGVLLRNIILPRDETITARTEQALKGLAQLGPSGELQSLYQEIRQILGQYNQHKEQVLQQIDEAIRAQLMQQLAQQGQQVSDPKAINPSMHPKYREEVARAEGDLNGQYNQALDERKESIRQRL